MAVPKKRVSRTRKNLRHTNWKKDVIPQALKALSLAKSSRTTRGNFRFAGVVGNSLPSNESPEPTEPTKPTEPTEPTK